jgi:hypothetical protein
MGQKKRTGIDVQKKIRLALNAIPGFKPDGWSSESHKRSIQNVDSEGKSNFDQPCLVCESNDQEDMALLCDNCDMCMHFFCIGLKSVPCGAWICPWCEQAVPVQTEEVIMIKTPHALRY